MSESESLLHLLLPLVDVTAPGIFRLSGNNTRQQRLIDALRTGQDTKTLELNSHDVATVVKQVLREYPGRLFDSTAESYLSRLVKNDNDTTFHRMQDILKQLAPERISLLGVVLPFLHKVSLLSGMNKMDASNLARVFALDFFPDISNPLGTDSTLVRQIIDWRIKVVEKLIIFGDKIIDETACMPVTPVSQIPSSSSLTPVNGKCDSTRNTLPGDASQKRKRPPQSPLKSVWHGLTNIFSKTPRPGRPESTPPNGTPNFFTKFSSRLIASGKKIKQDDEETCGTLEGYRSDDNSLRCPPVKQNLRGKFSHKKKSPKPATPGRLKTPSTPIIVSNYGTFTKKPFSTKPPDQVRTELFHFTDSTVPDSGAKNDSLLGAPFVFSSQHNVSQQNYPAPTTSLPQPQPFLVDQTDQLSPVNISPDIPQSDEDDDEDEENRPNPLVSSRMTGECSNSNENQFASEEDAATFESDAMETEHCENDIPVKPALLAGSLIIAAKPSPSMSNLSEEMRDSVSDLLNIGVTPRCRQPIVPVKAEGEVLMEPVVETTFDGQEEAQMRLIAQVRRQLGPMCPNASSGSRRPSVANLERSAMVSQGRRLWEQGGPCTSSMSNYASAFNLAVQNAIGDDQQLQSHSYPRIGVSSSKRQTDL